MRPCSRATFWCDSHRAADLLPAFAMWTAFPSPDYYAGSAPSGIISRRRACPPPCGGRATPEGSHVHSSSDRRVRCPPMPLRPRHTYAADLRCSLPAGDFKTGSEVSRSCGCAPLPSPYPPDWSWWRDLRGVMTLVPHVHLPVLLAGPGPSGSAGPFRRCQGCLPPFPASPGSGCPQLRAGCCDSPLVESFHLHSVEERLVALEVRHPQTVGSGDREVAVHQIERAGSR